MTRKERLERHMDFLNESYDKMTLSPIDNLTEIATKYGVHPSFVTFLRGRGTITPLSNSKRYPQWTTNREMHYNEADVSMLLNEYATWRLNEKHGSHTALIPTTKEGIAVFTTRQLLDELKRRGYSGKLTIKKEVTV